MNTGIDSEVDNINKTKQFLKNRGKKSFDEPNNNHNNKTIKKSINKQNDNNNNADNDNINSFKIHELKNSTHNLNKPNYSYIQAFYVFICNIISFLLFKR